MKFSLVFLLCSYVAGECMPPHIHSTQFDDEYDCLTVGYSESLIKTTFIESFTLLNSFKIDHSTPFNTTQNFLF